MVLVRLFTLLEPTLFDLVAWFVAVVAPGCVNDGVWGKTCSESPAIFLGAKGCGFQRSLVQNSRECAPLQRSRGGL